MSIYLNYNEVVFKWLKTPYVYLWYSWNISLSQYLAWYNVDFVFYLDVQYTSDFIILYSS